ncbi:hypothetical protein AB0L88_39250 [Saccharopolyspora shandongensis]|uniref:hypothetical protein n=1 Tax=Saccharopolyspora shandongensis TaxID=418495 RepID=UPI00341CC5D1
MHILGRACSKAARILLVGALMTPALLGLAGLANAHPFGTPPVARIAAHGNAVDVVWSAANDDLAVLRSEADAANTSEAQYLGSHIRLSQDGHPCPPR